MSSILKVKDKDGNWIDITAIKGEDGKSAYEQAKEGGFTGTEEEFIAFLNGLLNPVSVIDDTAEDHIVDKNNPHNVTAEQTGAIPETYIVSTDLNNELQGGGDKMKVRYYNSTTLNSPYKEGVTVYAHGMVITNAHNTQYGMQLCMPSGDTNIYIRGFSKQGVNGWRKVADMTDINALNTRVADVEADLESATSQGAKIASGQYTGTGTFGESNKNSLTFPFVPKIVFISTPSTVASGTSSATRFAPATFVNGANIGFISQSTEDANRSYDIPLTLIWADKTLSWYYVNTSTTSSGMTAANQMNYSGMVYKWVAIG